MQISYQKPQNRTLLIYYFIYVRTSGGVLRGEGGEVTAPPLLWVKSLDMVMDRLIVAGVDFSTIEALSGAAQVNNLRCKINVQKMFPCCFTPVFCET